MSISKLRKSSKSLDKSEGYKIDNIKNIYQEPAKYKALRNI